MESKEITGVIELVSTIREHSGKLQIGWTLNSNPNKWYNVAGEEGELGELLENIISKGNEIKFNCAMLSGEVTNLTKTKEAEKTDKKSSKWEDDIVNFETLLTAAHNLKKPFSINTEMLALDREKKYALFKATVKVYATAEEYSKYCIGEVSEESKHHKRMLLQEFEGHGDTTDENVLGEHIKPHFIRMAETRAICRALRWYTNNGCAEEEK